jgi:MFS family permease
VFGRSSTTQRDPDLVGDDLDDRDRLRSDPAVAHEARRERFGGLNLGAAFFGWLVAVAVSVLLTGIIGAVAAAVGYHSSITQGQAERQAGTIGLVAAIVLLAVLMLGYYSGGYVAGRMSRFSGSRQGLGVWLIGLIVTIIAVALGAVFGQQYDVLGRVNLPRLPVSLSSLSTAGVVAAILVLVGTLLAALAGGSVGTHYHRRVDRAGWDV